MSLASKVSAPNIPNIPKILIQNEFVFINCFFQFMHNSSTFKIFYYFDKLFKYKKNLAKKFGIELPLFNFLYRFTTVLICN